MFTARFNDASAENRKDLVRGRANNLETRLEQLREQRAELKDRADGDLTLAERAKAARLTARINALEASIDTTSTAAERAGVDSNRLQQLRSQASELNGSEVSEMARGLAGVGRDDTRSQSQPSQEDGSPDSESQGNSSTSGDGDGGDGGDGEPSGPGENPGKGQGQGDPNDDATTGNTSDDGASSDF
jgi:hypothetical protein